MKQHSLRGAHATTTSKATSCTQQLRLGWVRRHRRYHNTGSYVYLTSTLLFARMRKKCKR